MENQLSSRKSASRLAYVAAFLFFVLILLFNTIHDHLAIGIVAVAFHLMLFPVVAQLPSNEWARAAGYGWLVLDIAANIMLINGVDENICTALRYGAHIPAVIWIVTSSFYCNSQMLTVGILQGLFMGGYSFIAPWAPMSMLDSAAVLLIIWLTMAGMFLGKKD